MTPLTYRKAVPADIELLVEIENKCFEACDAFSRRALRGMIKNSRGSIILDILEVAGVPAGYAAYLTRQNSTYIRLYSLCLLPTYQGQGLIAAYLGERLPSFVPKYKEVGLEVRVNNMRAENLYSKLGFAIKEKLQHYYAGGKEDGYRMVKALIDH